MRLSATRRLAGVTVCGAVVLAACSTTEAPLDDAATGGTTSVPQASPESTAADSTAPDPTAPVMPSAAEVRDTEVGPVAVTDPASFADVDFYDADQVTVQPGDLTMAYVDEGPADGPVVLLLHGNPAWSYYYRDVIAALVDQGYRVVAPDLIGFGRSDKPLDRQAQTYANQIAWVGDFVARLDLTDVVLHTNDWGGLIGLRVVPEMPDRFAAVGIVNTGLPDGQEAAGGFQFWQRNSQTIEQFSSVLQRGSTRELDAAELAAFDAPWPDPALLTGPRELPLQVPFGDDPEAAANGEVLQDFWAEWERPFGIVFADGGSAGAPGIDPVAYADLVPGTIPDQPVLVPDTGHYLHLDVPDVVVDTITALARAADRAPDTP